MIAMPGQERREMRLDRHGTDAGSAAAVRDAERLVQVEVRHVGAEMAGRREPDQRVEVRAVDVHLAAVRVHDLADAA